MLGFPHPEIWQMSDCLGSFVTGGELFICAIACCRSPYNLKQHVMLRSSVDNEKANGHFFLTLPPNVSNQKSINRAHQQGICSKICETCLKKNQNAPRPSEHPPVRGEKMSKRLGGIKGCKYKTSSWDLNGFPDANNIGSIV